MNSKLKALILSPTIGGLALLVWFAIATSLDGTDSGTTLVKTLVPIGIGIATVLSIIVEAIAM